MTKGLVTLLVWLMFFLSIQLGVKARQSSCQQPNDRQKTFQAMPDSTKASKGEAQTDNGSNRGSADGNRKVDAQSSDASASAGELDSLPQATPSPAAQSQSSSSWHYGGFFDVGYLLDFNHPANRVFRSRGTTWHVDRPQVNMAAFYVRKKPAEDSRWGLELTAQGGKDAELFGFSATAPNIGGSKFLRQLGPTNVSYLALVGKGLTIQGGIFSSFIGYDSLYAKDNFNYTRPWSADFTPYLMMGVNASYPFTSKFTGTFFVVNGYWHLAHANNVPSWGGQAAISATSHVTVKQTVLVGPHQSNAAFKFWRFLSDTTVEHKTEKRTIAFETNFSTEQVNTVGTLRAWWFSAQAPMRWTLNPRWALAVRPEVAQDTQGRWTLARQTVVAFTSTLEYKLPYKSSNTIFRFEYRFDRSIGPDGGFFRGREVSPGVIGLTPSQHLLVFATIFTLDR
jgi:Putative beta-barrel porin-2, OmpL-like. bbp2